MWVVKRYDVGTGIINRKTADQKYKDRDILDRQIRDKYQTLQKNSGFPLSITAGICVCSGLFFTYAVMTPLTHPSMPFDFYQKNVAVALASGLVFGRAFHAIRSYYFGIDIADKCRLRYDEYTIQKSQDVATTMGKAHKIFSETFNKKLGPGYPILWALVRDEIPTYESSIEEVD